jgi:hypothetical protein
MNVRSLVSNISQPNVVARMLEKTIYSTYHEMQTFLLHHSWSPRILASSCISHDPPVAPHGVQRWPDLEALRERGRLYGLRKSTMIKVALRSTLLPRDEDDLILSFFFDAKDVCRQRSRKGMLRSLTYQILLHVPACIEVLEEMDMFSGGVYLTWTHVS